MFLFSGTAVYASNDIKVIIDGETQSYDNDQPPVMKNYRTLVPMRGIFEALGAEVKWYADTQTVEAIKGNTAIVLQIGSYIAYVNGEQVILDQPAEIINGRTMVQIRFVGEALGAKVEWEATSNSVIITSNDEETIETDEYVNNIHAYRDNLNLINYAKKGDYAQVKKLLENGVDVNAGVIKTGYTPLMGAAENGDLSIVELLIGYRAEYTIKDLKGKTAMDYAIANGHDEVIELLKEMGVLDSDYGLIDSDAGVKISVTETNNSIVNINGIVNDPQNKWVWFLIKKNGTNEEKDVIIPVENNQFSKDLYLSMGPGEYTIKVYENIEEYGYYTLNTKFNVTNLDTRDPYLLPSERIESEDARIIELANEITEGYDTDIAKSRAIYGWVIKNIKYDDASYFNGEDVSHSALEVLQLGTTDCDGYARLTAALHRAVGIEVKVVFGDTTGYDRPFDEIVDHAWNEVFIDGEWITLDPTWGVGYIDSKTGEFVSSINFDYYDPTDDFFAETHIKMGELYE